MAHVQLLRLSQGPHIVLIMFCASELGAVPEFNICAGAIVAGNASIAATLVDIHVCSLSR